MTCAYICKNCGTVLHETLMSLFDGTILHYVIHIISTATLLTRFHLVSKTLCSLPECQAIWFLRDKYLLEMMDEIDGNPRNYPTLTGLSPCSSRVSSGKQLHDISIDFAGLLKRKCYLPYIVVMHIGAANLNFFSKLIYCDTAYMQCCTY